MYDFDNKVVVVTGAAGALGQAVTNYFNSNGATVVCLDYSDEILAQSFPYSREANSLYLVSVDLTSREICKTAFVKILQKFGRVDILCNMAGGFLMGEKVHETSDEAWDFLFNLNTRSVLNTSAVVVPSMLEQGAGKIINVAASAANRGRPAMGAYVASKCSVLRLTETMALELRDKNINVNSVLPSVMDTQRNRKDMPNADYTKWVQPSSVANVIGFLASTAAKDIHGVGIPINGLS